MVVMNYGKINKRGKILRTCFCSVHVEAYNGYRMACFIEQYVRKPVADVSQFEKQINVDGKGGRSLLDFEAKYLGSEVVIKLGTHERRISRREDNALVAADEDEE